MSFVFQPWQLFYCRWASSRLTVTAEVTDSPSPKGLCRSTRTSPLGLVGVKKQLVHLYAAKVELHRTTSKTLASKRTSHFFPAPKEL